MADKPVKVSAVVSFDEKTIADTAAQNECSNASQKSTKNATWAAFYAVAAYAVVTTLMWCSMIEQNRIARAALSQTDKEWKIQQRAWVGVFGKLEFPKQPKFEVFPANTPKSTGIDITTSFTVKNVGFSLAIKTASEVKIWMTEDTLVSPQFQMDLACQLADATSEKEGNAIFPSGEITTTFETLSNQQIELTHIRRVWIIACTSYRDTVSQAIHHTKFWIVSFLIPENTVPIIIERKPIVTMFTLPIGGWNIVKTEAD